MDFDPEAIYREVLKAGETWADTKAAYEALDDNTKSVLADITGNFLDGASKVSKSEAEMRALSSGLYKNHLATVSAARKEWLRAQVRYESLKMMAEMRRSQESTRRAELGLR